MVIHSLNGPAWRLAQARIRQNPPEAAELARLEEWLPADVPGDVRLDLQRAGRLPADLYYGTNSLQTSWVEDHDWWVAREFALALEPGRRAHLVLLGVDYISSVFLNGELLGRHEGMFSPQVYEITARLREPDTPNMLAVAILGAAHLPRRRGSRREGWLDQLEARTRNPVTALNYRRQVVKSQMGFGWDFAPAMRTMGIWDDVFVRVTGPVALHVPYARPVLSAGGAQLRLSLGADASAAGPAELAVELGGATWPGEPQSHRFALVLQAGPNPLEFTIPVEEPRLWWPWERGRPDLYDLTVTLLVDGNPSDVWQARVGLREVALAPNDGAPPGSAPWTFVINGQRLFVRGANWVPADAFPARVTDADYAALLGLAVDANMNMLRVWGGGVREKRGFYAEADRLGLLIWQEFPHACAFAARFPRSEEYLRLAAQEAGAIVRALRNHPSVVLWCGGNEFSPRRNRPLVDALAGAAAAEDGSRPFHPASPSGGEGHNWIVWHQRAPVSDYRADDGLFASEFGLQAVPGIDSLQRFIPPGELWPPGPAWLHHNAELAKLAFYARPYVAAPEPAGRPAYTSEWTAHFDSAETFATATQRAQADGLQVAIEHFRRRKGRAGGCLVWQLNEPWPAISWSLIDYYRVPKQAYRRVQRVYNPLLVSLEFALRQYQAGETVSAAVWVINDWPRALPDCEIEVSLGQGPPLWTARRDVAADSVERIGELRFVLPPHGPGAWALVARIAQAGRLLGENGYQLDTHDWRRLPLAARLAARWAKRLLE